MDKKVKDILFMLWMLSAAGSWIYGVYLATVADIDGFPVIESGGGYYIILGWIFYFIGCKFSK